MTIGVDLDRLLLDRRMTLTVLAECMGITIANLSILKTGKARAKRRRPTSLEVGLQRSRRIDAYPAMRV